MARRLVIIGGDAAGMSAAAQARRMTSTGEFEIVAFERGSRTSYATCGLPYLVGGLVDTPELRIARTPEQHRTNGIDVRIHHEVSAIDTMTLTVTVRDLETGRESVRWWPAREVIANRWRNQNDVFNAIAWQTENPFIN
jgi:NADPH-dependent 2,4-dienoyl-CoA reductase/sulfur reductase-like enzyme